MPAATSPGSRPYTDDELCGVRVLAVLPNRFQEYRAQSTVPASERLAILGEFPVRKADGSTDALGDPDTSFKVRLPADTPYVMQGIDCEGRTLNTDQTWQHVRPGELRTCNGCHVHSGAANDLPFANTRAGQGQVPPVLLGGGTVPLLAGGSGAAVTTTSVASWGVQVEFERDVMPIFASRCVSCHGAERADAGLRLDIPRTEAMRAGSLANDNSTWRRLANDNGQTFVPAEVKHGTRQGVLAKPNLSKYLRMLNARGSLLYWKANNARTDGRTDAQYPSAPTDGVTTDITADELRTLARWIDLGAMWGPAVFEDTLAPTLALEGVFANDALTAGAIGTTDVGTGIDPASLTVCIDSGTGTCAALAPGEAAMAGTITLPLATAPALDDELVVSVRDVAGNTTTVRRTVRALLNQPPPNPDVPDDDGPDAGPEPDPGTPTDGSADGDDVVSAGCGCGASTPSTAAVWLSTLLLVGLLRRRRP